MIVQWCIKGLALPGDDQARAVIDGRGGLLCNWWRAVGTITPQQCRQKLTAQNLDLHVNHFDRLHPATGVPFSAESPFISLSAGTVERDAVAQTNHVRRARRTALWFGTRFGQEAQAYLYTCWTVLAPRQAVEVGGLAEEVRDLNTFRRYSAFQTEGEIAAKVIVPDNHIDSCERWDLTGGVAPRFVMAWRQDNPRFTSPTRLTNVRELI